MALVDLNLECLYSTTKQLNVHDWLIPGEKGYFITFTLLPIYCRLTYQTKEKHCHDQDGSAGCASSRKAKGHRFDSLLELVPGLQFRSWVGACVRSNWSMFLSHINVSLPLFLPRFPSL